MEYQQVIELCKSGNLQELQHIIEQQNINMTDFNNLFSTACQYGQLDMAKWLLQIKPDIDISTNNDYAFRWVCYKGYLDIAKWLLQIKPDINISAEDEFAFRWACLEGHIHIVKWFRLITLNFKLLSSLSFGALCVTRLQLHL